MPAKKRKVKMYVVDEGKLIASDASEKQLLDHILGGKAKVVVRRKGIR